MINHTGGWVEWLTEWSCLRFSTSAPCTVYMCGVHGPTSWCAGDHNKTHASIEWHVPYPLPTHQPARVVTQVHPARLPAAVVRPYDIPRVRVTPTRARQVGPYRQYMTPRCLYCLCRAAVCTVGALLPAGGAACCTVLDGGCGWRCAAACCRIARRRQSVPQTLQLLRLPQALCLVQWCVLLRGVAQSR